MLSRAIRGLSVCAVVLAASAVSAQDYPARPVRMVVPLTAGSGADIAGRIVGRKLTEVWKQSVIADNRPGAGGQIGTQLVVSANPDGYTWLVQSASHAANPAIYEKLPYDSLKDLADVALLGTSPYIMVAAPAGPYRTLKDLIDAAKAKPGVIPFASAGVGSSTHLTAEYFAQAAGIKMIHVPFKGSPEAITDAATGRVSFYMAPIGTAIGMAQENRVRVLGVTSAKRVPQLPNVPTIAEQGLTGFAMDLWFGLWVPAGTPRAIVQKINVDVNQVLKAKDVQDQYEKLGMTAGAMSADQFAAFVRSEIDKYQKIVKTAGIKPL
ncbi:MAG: Bug family tripartite tricarboxylate transporter substrate binding protein [Rhodospirillaceae bacterium]